MPARATSNTSPEVEDGKRSDVESEEENEEEYEIEEILDAKRGYFPGGTIAYFVKWKGYGSDENSWVKEDDAGNAQALIDAYWAKQKHKKGASEAKPSKKARQSTGSVSAARGSASAAGKKRGRASAAANKDSGSEDEDMSVSVDHARDDSPPTAKRARKGTTPAAKSSKIAPKSAVSDSTSPAPQPVDESYYQYSQWEKFVKSIDTVERQGDGQLMIYFTMTNGQRAFEPASVGNQRFPQKLLKFYERNLRWKSGDENDEQGESE